MTIENYFNFFRFSLRIYSAWMSSRLPIYDYYLELRSLRSLVITYLFLRKHKTLILCFLFHFLPSPVHLTEDSFYVFSSFPAIFMIYSFFFQQDFYPVVVVKWKKNHKDFLILCEAWQKCNKPHQEMAMHEIGFI